MYQPPSDSLLFESLNGLLKPAYDLAEITSRQRLLEASTYPVECVTCRMADGTELALFCKYLAGGGPNAFGHRGGVEYESMVYQKLLKAIPLTTIHYYGDCRIGSNDMMVVLAFMGHYLRFVKSGDPDGLVKAAAWIGSFHKLMQGRSPEFVRKYDHEYYQSWVNHFREVNAVLWNSHPELERLVQLFQMHLPLLLGPPLTIIHGEYYPRNILLKAGVIFPVDWESAAIAPGEIDLASLIEDWPKKEVDRTLGAYVAARWPEGGENEKSFRNRLLMARIYFFIRYCPWNTKPAEWIGNEWIHANMMSMIKEAEALNAELQQASGEADAIKGQS